MKRVISLIIILSVIMSIGTFFTAYADEVLISEGFEEGIDKLIFDSDTALSCVKITDLTKSEGSKSIFIFDKGMDYGVKASVPAKNATGNTVYSVSADAYVFKGNARVYLEFLDINSKIISTVTENGKEGGWENIIVKGTAPEKTSFVRASVGISDIQTGEVFFDNVRVVKGEVKATVPGGNRVTATQVAGLTASSDGVEDGAVLFYDSFEEGYDKNWTLYGGNSEGKVDISDTVSYEGKKSVHIIDDIEGGTAGIKTDKIPVTPGNVYTVYANLKAVSGKDLRIYYRIYDEAGKTLKSTAVIPEGDLWQAGWASLYAPGGSSYIQLVVAGMGSLKGEIYLDNISIVKGLSKPTDPKVTNPWDVEDGERIFYEDFEDGYSFWSYQSTKSPELTFIETKNVYEGSKSVKIVDPDTTGPGIKSPFIPVMEGAMYTVDAMLYLSEGSGLKLFVRHFDGNKKQIASASANAVLGRWEHATVYLPAPDGAKYCQVVIAGLGSNTGTLYADSIAIYKGSYKPEKEYVDFIPPGQVPSVDAKIAAPVNGKLVYTPYSEKGDILGDYSYAGFFNGEYQLPITENLPVAIEIAPTGTKDDTAHLQAAVDKVSEMAALSPIKVLKLKEGKYYINKNGIKMKSGVLLSGSGQGPEGTVLYAFEPVKYTVVSYYGEEPEGIGEKIYLTDSYIPSGSKTVSVSLEDAKKLSAGEEIILSQPSTEEWAEAIEMMGMTDIYGGDSSWSKGKIPMLLERTITAVNGTEITLDFGVHMPYMGEFAPISISRNGDEGRIENGGIENLRIESYYNGNPTDENHADNAISIVRSKNIFVRDVTTKHFSNAGVTCQYKSKQITVKNCSYLEPICSSGSAKRYSFTTSRSSQLLYTGCYANNALIAYGTGYPCTGPVSFVDNVNDEGASTVETHGTWSTAVLFDNIYNVPSDAPATISLANNGKYGTSATASQGWTTASAVAWNCLASAIVVQDVPLGYQNFGVGIFGIYSDKGAMDSKAKRIEKTVIKYKTSKQDTCPDSAIATEEGTPFIGDGYFEAKYTPVNPRSIFKAQLSERFTGSIINAKPNAPVINYPKADSKLNDNSVTVKGMCQLGASKVTVYIDNIPYEAQIGEDNLYTLTVNLKNGNHKIYATQTVDGVEGCKGADRFITVKESDGNPEYLQSIYGEDKTSMLINDPRPTFDRILNDVKVYTDGKLLVSDVRPLNLNGRVLVPMRAIFEKLRATVSWDGATETATAVKDGTEIKITRNQAIAYKNNEPVTLDVPATIINGRFVVPVRFISESFGCEVGWEGEDKAVTVKIPKDNGKKTFDNIRVTEGIQPVSVTQSSDDGYLSYASNMFDNDHSTMWMAKADENGNYPYVIIDLGESKNLNAIDICYYGGKARTYTHSISVSEDNLTYTPVVTDGTTTRKNGFEAVSLAGKTGRYVKIEFKGSTFGRWNMVEEIRLN
ncbi:MAG: hypothetical protein E7411_07780 [Ruminococcaceae bacterium]|nr:hypothetical protein [Oscillospiraceae bacterium]